MRGTAWDAAFDSNLLILYPHTVSSTQSLMQQGRMNVYPGFISTKRDLEVKMTFSDLSLCTEMKLESSLLLHYATKSTCVNGTCESLVSTVDDSRWFSEETIYENKKKKQMDGFHHR